MLARTKGVNDVIEFGANIGLNLIALRQLLPAAELAAVEINEKAATELAQNVPNVTLYQQSILHFQSTRRWDLVFTKGVLIHMAPASLPQVYALMHEASRRYIMVAEYYNPSPTEVLYRGHSGKLFKRDFAGEILEMFQDMVLLDYGFCYHRDHNFRQDDLTWFLLEKKGKQ